MYQGVLVRDGDFPDTVSLRFESGGANPSALFA